VESTLLPRFGSSPSGGEDRSTHENAAAAAAATAAAATFVIVERHTREVHEKGAAAAFDRAHKLFLLRLLSSLVLVRIGLMDSKFISIRHRPERLV
jgi:hypothetical protein